MPILPSPAQHHTQPARRTPALRPIVYRAITQFTQSSTSRRRATPSRRAASHRCINSGCRIAPVRAASRTRCHVPTCCGVTRRPRPARATRHAPSRPTTATTTVVPMRMGDTPLVEAARNGDASQCAELLARGADANQPKSDGSGATPLHVACQEGHAAVVTQLLRGGAAVNQPTAETYSRAAPLHVASHFGHSAVVRSLLDASASVQQLDINGYSPLYLASVRGHATTLVCLLEAGDASADIDHPAVHGELPLRRGRTPMLGACLAGQLPCVQLLSAHGASRTILVDGDHVLAEDEAATGGHDALCEWLRLSRYWTTPLHHLTIIDGARALVLLRAGADIHSRAADGPEGAPTPVMIAQAMWDAGDAGARPGSPADLVLRAARPWSRETHHLFPAPARARAVQMLLIGHRLSRSARFEHMAVGLFDVWMDCVMPCVVVR